MNYFSANLRPRTSEHAQGGRLCDAYVELKDEIAAYLSNKVGLTSGDAEDCVQTAFEKIMRLGDEQLRQIKNEKAFLYRTAYNAAIDLVRRSQVGSKHVEQVSRDGLRLVDGVDPYRQAAAKEELGTLVRMLEKMPEKRRQLVLMNRVQLLSYAEIGRRVGLSESAVRKHVNRALSDLMKVLRVKTGGSRG